MDECIFIVFFCIVNKIGAIFMVR